jgi:hypothetical protein
VKEAIEITIRGYFDKHPRDVVLFLISQESAAIDIHSASDEWLYTPTMAQAIPHPSISDDFEYLGAFNGEQRWRSDGGARLTPGILCTAKSRCSTAQASIWERWTRKQGA